MSSPCCRFSLFVGATTLFLAMPALLAREDFHSPEFVFDTGPPAWAGERIVLPPGFAPELGWHGVEEIRFAPGMFEPDAPDFFSYVLVFLLEPGSDISEAGLKRELLGYYRGLSEAVMKSRGQAVATEDFALTLEKAKEPHRGAPVSAPEAVAWTARLDWVEPFATQMPQTLRFEIHVWKHGGQPVVFSSVSPANFDATLPWRDLRIIRERFRFEP